MQISGRMTANDANDVALLLRAGALAAPMEIIEERTIGPSLGAENIAKGVHSVLWGFRRHRRLHDHLLQRDGCAFRLSRWRSTCCSWWRCCRLIQATLTLPGIAAIALTVGMAIDANVLINERIREELRGGQRRMRRFTPAIERAFATILDSNVTNFIAGMALFAYGSGPVRGFAVVLCIGIVTSIFSGGRRVARPGQSHLWPPPAARTHLRSDGKLDATEWNSSASSATSRSCPTRRTTTIISLMTFLLAVFFLVTRGLNFSVEFTGGTVIEVHYSAGGRPSGGAGRA